MGWTDARYYSIQMPENGLFESDRLYEKIYLNFCYLVNVGGYSQPWKCVLLRKVVFFTVS